MTSTAMFSECFSASRQTAKAIAAAEQLGRHDFRAIVVLEHLALANVALLKQFRHIAVLQELGGLD